MCDARIAQIAHPSIHDYHNIVESLVKPVERWELKKKMNKKVFFLNRRALLCPPDLPWTHCAGHQLDGFQPTCWGHHHHNCDNDDVDGDDNDDDVFIAQHIRQQYEAGHRLVAKVLASDNSSFTQVCNFSLFFGKYDSAWFIISSARRFQPIEIFTSGENL